METYPASSSASSSFSSSSFSSRAPGGGVPLRILRATVPPEDPLPVVRDASTLYAPPYESDLIDAFVWNLVKYLAPLLDLRVVTFRGGDAAVILDVPASAPGASSPAGSSRRRVAFLVDALPAPEPATLQEGATSDPPTGENVPDPLRRYVDVLYVLRPADIMHRLPDVLYLATQWDAALFSERGRTNLARLASAEARRTSVTPACHDHAIRYPNAASASSLLLDATLDVPGTVRVRRRAFPRRGTQRRRYRRSA